MKGFKFLIYTVFVFFLLNTANIFAQNSKDSEYSEIYNTNKFYNETKDDGIQEEIIPLVPFNRIPDSAEIRKKIAKNWFLAAPEEVAKKIPEIEYDSIGNRFKVRAVHLKERNLLAIVISPIDTEFSNIEKVPQGTWILYRNYTTGKPEYIKIYPRENPELYLQLKPESSDYEQGKSTVDICLFNAYVRKDVELGIPFNSLYYLSLLELKTNSKMILPWKIFDPPITYGGIEATADIIRDRLHKLVYIDDGAFDAFGNPIHLQTGNPQTSSEIISQVARDQKISELIGGVNCAGFSKWVVDGIIKPIAGQGIFINSLTTKTEVPDTYFTKPFESKKPFFGLEWIRNLAAASLTLNLKRTVLPVNSGVDVKIEPFALVPPIQRYGQTKNSSSYESFKGYEKNAGYQTKYLEALLYYLASSEPGHFYLGAVSREKGNPPLRYYHHIAIFFPYFDIFGNFHIAVFESAAETSIQTFMKKNTGTFTALVRIRAPQIGLFNP